MLTVQTIHRKLTEPAPGPVEVLEEATSTNTILKERAMAGAPAGTVLIALEQTAGRGRLGRQFLSTRGKGLYMSMLLRPNLPAEKLMPLTGLAAVAAAEAASSVSGADIGVKWVNDLILNGKKLGGILTELGVTPGESTPWAIIGIGVNTAFTLADFQAAALDTMATSFLREGLEADPSALAAALIQAFQKTETALRAGETERYLSAYRARCVTLGKPVKILYPAGEQEGTALDIDENFGLRVLRASDGTEDTVFFGEVSVRGYYGYA